MNMKLCFKSRKKRSSCDEEEEEDDQFFMKEKEFLMDNSRLLLEELIRSFNGKSNPIRIFSEQELAQATHNYAPARIIRKRVDCNFYTGIYEGSTVFIKKFHDEIYMRKASINEIVVASQINHKHLAKLLGCCLETQCPILVYDNNITETLSRCIYLQYRDLNSIAQRKLFSWQSRLKIASEIAYAIAYLHNFTSRPIVHRRIKPESILLDKNGVAKLSDFSTAIPIPLGKTHLEDEELVGILGFRAPDYVATGRLSEKADVYSFGVVVLVILTGRLAHDAQVGERSLVDQVKSSLRDGLLGTVLDPNVEGGEDELEGFERLRIVAEIGMRCTNEKEEERPTMIEVAKELQRVERSRIF